MSHTTPPSEINAQIEAAKAQVKIGGTYRHFRTGGDYEVISIGLCEWDEQPAVIYRRLADPTGPVWIRPLRGESGWLTPAVKNDTSVARFQLQP